MEGFDVGVRVTEFCFPFWGLSISDILVDQSLTPCQSNDIPLPSNRPLNEAPCLSSLVHIVSKNVSWNMWDSLSFTLYWLYCKEENSLLKTVGNSFDIVFISSHIIPCSPVESGPEYYLLLNLSKGTKWFLKEGRSSGSWGIESLCSD